MSYDRREDMLMFLKNILGLKRADLLARERERERALELSDIFFCVNQKKFDYQNSNIFGMILDYSIKLTYILSSLYSINNKSSYISKNTLY